MTKLHVGDSPVLGAHVCFTPLLNEDMSDKPFLFQFQHGWFLFACWEDEEHQEAPCLCVNRVHLGFSFHLLHVSAWGCCWVLVGLSRESLQMCAHPGLG